jgi:cytochrome subunit of sulfide dehydrogenase
MPVANRIKSGGLAFPDIGTPFRAWRAIRVPVQSAAPPTEETMIRHRTAVATLVLIATGAFAQSTDPLARDVAASCSNCHGTNGKSVGPVPSLAGATKSDLVTKMQEFKSGKRPGTIMPQLAKGYTDDQIERTAAWFASQPAPAK